MSPEAKAHEREAQRRYYVEHREAVLAQQREHYARNRETVGAKAAARYAADPEPQKARSRKRNAEKRDEINAHLRDRYAEDSAAFKARRLAAQRKLRRDVIDGYGGRCACCGNAYLPHLTIDHVDGGGAEDRRRMGGGRGVYARLRREGYPPGYQVLCWSCNAAKHHLGTCGCQDEEG